MKKSAFSFFLSLKFWLPLAFFLLLELLIRLGVFNTFIEPRSFLGNSIYRKQAVEDYGLEKIHWITLGDSIIDWGIDHGRILALSTQKNQPQIRMSFESAYLVSFQGITNWSVDHMPNLQGVVLGLNMNRLASMGNADWNNRILQPFRAVYDYNYHYPYYTDENVFYAVLRTLQTSGIWVTAEYFSKFLTHPFQSWKKIQHKRKNLASELTYKRNVNYNTCQYPIKNVQECVAAASEIKQKTTQLSSLENMIINRCGTAASQQHARVENFSRSIDTQTVEVHAQRWAQFFQSILDKDLELIVVVLPDSEIMRNYFNAQNIHSIKQAVFSKFEQHANFTILDLSHVFAQSNRSDCQYFVDYLHYTNTGIELITEALVSKLKHLSLAE